MMNEPSGTRDNGGETGEESGEDLEESLPLSLSSSLSDSDPVHDALETFRKEWQRELEVSAQSRDENSARASNIDVKKGILSTENQAKSLYLKGVKCEKNGALYDAITFYKRAVQLVPDIEFRLYESSQQNVQDKVKSSNEGEEAFCGAQKKCEDDANDNSDNSDDDDDDDTDDILTKLMRRIGDNHPTCYPKFEQSAVHISALPTEILLYILRWVVSAEMDIPSLEVFSRVCRGFFICSRDPEIWRSACIRIWSVNCGNYEPNYHSWREMYIKRPKLRYNGCYISKITYIRHGENSYRDKFYRPWHFVEYFRYLRFYPDGRVLMLTSADDMQSCVNSLRNRDPQNSSALIGYYRLQETSVKLVLSKQENKVNIGNFYRRRKPDRPHDSNIQTYRVELDIQSHHERQSWQLNWIGFDIITKGNNGVEQPTSLNVCGRYPPFRFSKVKSYTQNSVAPL